MNQNEARIIVIDALIREQLSISANNVTAFIDATLRYGFNGFANMSSTQLVTAALGMRIETRSSEIATAVCALTDNVQEGTCAYYAGLHSANDPDREGCGDALNHPNYQNQYPDHEE